RYATPCARGPLRTRPELRPAAARGCDGDRPQLRSPDRVRSAPGGRPRVLVDVVLEPHDLAVLHHVDVLEGGVELGAALRPALEAAGDDDPVSLIVEILRLGRELLEVLRHRAEHIVADALRTVEGAR